MMQSLRIRGGVVIPAVMFVLVAGAASAALVSMRTNDASGGGTALRNRSKLNDPEAAAVLLLRLGVSADALAAAGLSTEQCDGILLSMPSIAPAGDRMIMIAQATSSLAQAKERSIRAPQAGDEALPTVSQAQTVLDALLDEAFTAAVGSLPPDRITILRSIRHNGQKISAPAYYLVTDRTDAEWLALRTALAGQRITARLNTTLDQQSQSVLSAVGGEPAVTAARTAHEINATAFRTLWRTRLEQPQP